LIRGICVDKCRYIKDALAVLGELMGELPILLYDEEVVESIEQVWVNVYAMTFEGQ
jgi:hypothetical protein